MLNTIISIIISIVASFIYDGIKKGYSSRKQENSVPEIYSKEYVLSVKKEFYWGFFLGIIFISIPDTNYEFFNLLFNILAYFSFFVALMGFMCLVDVINHLFNKDTNK